MPLVERLLHFNLSLTQDVVFVGGEFFQAHGAAGVQFVGADADFGPHTEFGAVSESRRGVHVDRRGIDPLQEGLLGLFRLGENGVGMLGAKVVDVVQVGENHLRLQLVSDGAHASRTRLTAMAFRAMDSDLGTQLLSSKNKVIQLIGKANANHWQDRVTPQFIVDDAII